MNKKFYSILFILVLLSSASHAQFWKKKKQKEEFDEAGFVSNRFHQKFFEGMREYGMENYDKAIEAFDKCIEIDPSSMASRFQLSKVYWAKGTKSMAIENANQAFLMATDNEDVYQNLLDFLLNTRNYQAAIKASNTYIATLSQNQSKAIKYRKELARYYEYGRDYENALLVYNDLEEDYGYLNAYALERLRIYKRTGKLNEALTEIDGLIDENPGATTFVYQKASLLREKGNYDEALIYFAKVLNDKPDHGRALIESGEILLLNGQDEGLVRVKKAFSLNDLEINDKINAYNRLSANSLKSDDKIALAKALVETNPESPAANRALADAFFNVNNKKEGVVYLAEARALDPDNFSFLLDLVTTYYELNDFENLRKNAVEGADIYPSHNVFYLYAGIAFMELDDFDNALIMLETGKSFAIGNNGMKNEFKMSLADLFYRMGEFEESNKVFDDVLSLEPNNATALNNYAYFLSKRGESLDKAETMVKKAIDLRGGNASFYDTYGFVLFKKEDYKQAIEFFDKALEEDENSAEILEHKGDAYFKLGEADKALEFWEKAKLNGGDSEVLLRKIKRKTYFNE